MKLLFTVRLTSEIPSVLSSHCTNPIDEATTGRGYVVNIAALEYKPHAFPFLKSKTRY